MTKLSESAIMLVACVAISCAMSCIASLLPAAYANEDQVYSATRIDLLFPQSDDLSFTGARNAGMHDYLVNGSPARSFLHVVDGALERVEYIQGELVVERVSSDFKHVDSKRVVDQATYTPSDLSADNEILWGGFFAGANSNFVVTGQDNAGEDDSRTVIRITKYSKAWTYESNFELKGRDESGLGISKPFYLGSCSMAELGGVLYVRTCQWTYGGYAYNPQAHNQYSMTLYVDEASMTTADLMFSYDDLYYDHIIYSLNQHIVSAFGSVYKLDHGARDPRRLVITGPGMGFRNGVDLNGDASCSLNTGASTGGLTYSNDTGKLLYTCNIADQNAFADSGYSENTVSRNVWLGVVSPQSGESAITHLTDYDSESEEYAGTPFIVKISENRFIVIWSVRLLQRASGTNCSQSSSPTEICYTFVDGNGNVLDEVKRVKGALSDCQPILFGDRVVWYTGHGDTLNFYAIRSTSGAYESVQSEASASLGIRDIALDGLSGEKGNLREAYEGKRFVAIVGRPACGITQSVLSQVRELAAETEYSDVAFLVFDIDDNRVAFEQGFSSMQSDRLRFYSPSEGSAISYNSWAWGCFRDSGGVGSSITLPFVFVVDNEGVVQRAATGLQDMRSLLRGAFGDSEQQYGDGESGSVAKGDSEPESNTKAIAIPYKHQDYGFEERSEHFGHGLEWYLEHAQPGEYNPQLSHLLMAVSSAAYRKDTVEKAFENLGFRKNVPTVEGYKTVDEDNIGFAINDMQDSKGNRIVLIAISGSHSMFDGSTGEKEWQSNINLGEGMWQGRLRHQGFANAAEKVVAKTAEHLHGVSTDGVTYVVTGHSRGAGVANIVEAMLVSEYGVPANHVYGYNFATPDVAVGSSDDWLAGGRYANIFNVNNSQDPIGFLPGAFGNAIKILFANSDNLRESVGVQWGKYGNSLWFAKGGWSTFGGSVVYLGAHDWLHGYLEYLHGEPSVARFKSWAQVKVISGANMLESIPGIGSAVGMFKVLMTGVYVIGVHCPVDVFIKDGSSEVVASVEGGAADYHESKYGDVVVFVAGDEKFFVLPQGESYDIDLISTGEGEMTLDLRTGTPFADEFDEIRSFENVTLVDGKRFSLSLQGDSDSDDVELFVVDESGKVAEVLDDGSEIGQEKIQTEWLSMHRLYNQWSGEHFYTADDEEAAGLVEIGWTDEGEGWKAPETSSTSVFRLYNPYAGEHHYSMDASERDALIEAGWADEGIGWYSDDAKTVPLYREYNPYEFANNHNYTVDVDEHENLVSLGWLDEGYAWYGV